MLVTKSLNFINQVFYCMLKWSLHNLLFFVYLFQSHINSINSSQLAALKQFDVKGRRNICCEEQHDKICHYALFSVTSNFLLICCEEQRDKICHYALFSVTSNFLLICCEEQCGNICHYALFSVTSNFLLICCEEQCGNICHYALFSVTSNFLHRGSVLAGGRQV